MKNADTIARSRREFFVCAKTIKELVRELHVSLQRLPCGLGLDLQDLAHALRQHRNDFSQRGRPSR
jgi:hypothetical protein